MPEQRPTAEQIEELRRKRDALDAARKKALEEYIESLDQDEGDLELDGEDESDATEAEEIAAELDEADDLRVELEDGDHDDPEAGDDELVEKVSDITERLDELERSLRKRGIDPEL